MNRRSLFGIVATALVAPKVIDVKPDWQVARRWAEVLLPFTESRSLRKQLVGIELRRAQISADKLSESLERDLARLESLSL